MKCRTIVLVLIMALLAPVVVSAQQKAKGQFYVYLWDVTLSMRGPQYEGQADIWDKTIKWLKDEIKAKSTSSLDTIVVCPFQENIIMGSEGPRINRVTGEVEMRPYEVWPSNESITYDSPWKVPSTDNGKNQLIEKITNFKQPKNGHTNLYDPVLFAFDNYSDTTKYETTIYMLTDGIDDFNREANKSFTKYINKEWSEDCPLFVYIRLTSLACDDIKSKGNVLIIDPEERLMELCITASGSYDFRTAEKTNNRSLVLNVVQEQENYKLPDGIKIRVTSDSNPYITIDNVCEVVNGKIKVPINYNVQDIINSNIRRVYINLKYEVVDKKLGASDGYKYIMSVSNKSSKSFEFVNDTQKKLTIRLIKKEETDK